MSSPSNNYTGSEDAVFLDAFNEPWLSDEAKETILMIVYSVIGVGICSFGVFSNTVNIIVFAKQGFQETVNISLFAMAISDLGSVLTLLWVGICVNPLFKNSDIPFVAEGVNYITGEWPHAICVRITGWLTALVAFERCLCVIFPLKIKSIVTLFRIKVVVVAIFVLVIASMSPNFYFTRLGWMFIPERNRTMVAVFYTDDKLAIDSVAIFVHSTAPSLLYFFIISACTIMLVVNLQRQSKWRQKSSSANVDSEQQSRDKRIIKLVVTLASIFIACLVPHMIAMMYASLDPEFNLFGRHRNLFKIVGACVLTLEAVNSAINIFIYYSMSSKYKQVFRSLFCRDGKQDPH